MHSAFFRMTRGFALATGLILLPLAFAARPAHAQATSGGTVITFDNLPNEPTNEPFDSLTDANGGSNVIDGVSFSNTGDNPVTIFNVDGGYYVPQSGDYCISNGELGSPVTLGTDQTLNSVYVGGLEYEGQYDADTVTITAVGANGNALGSVTTGTLGSTLQYVDTSSFDSLSGIAGYDFTPNGGGLNNSGVSSFGMDTFTFAPTASAVPELSPAISIALLSVLGVAALGLGQARKRRANGSIA